MATKKKTIRRGWGQKRVMGLEPKTFTLARRKPTIATAANKAVASNAQSDCTSDCTANTKTGNRIAQDDSFGDAFAEAVAAIIRLPLSDAEKAEAVRRWKRETVLEWIEKHAV